MSSESDGPAADVDDESDGHQPKIRAEHITKQFGRIIALNDVSLDIQESEIFALVGDNGAGKSTLMNVLSGVYSPTKGQIYVDGNPVEFTNPSDARKVGIETVYQDLALMNDLDVAANIFMGKFPRKGFGSLGIIDWDETYRRSEEIIHGQLDRDINVDAEVQFFSGGERQLIAIARALAFNPEVLILDEPTSALSVDATDLVHRTIERLRDQGITVVIVSHSIESVLELADRIGVLFQGEIVEITDPSHTDLKTLTTLMTTGEKPAQVADD